MTDAPASDTPPSDTPLSDTEGERARLEARGLRQAELGDEPLIEIQRWWDHATAAGIRLAETMALATATAAGRPSVRFVLLRGLDHRGLAFYTNGDSAKGEELRDNPWASIVMAWHPISRQVRATGPVEPVTPAESDEYWASRPRGSQLAAWASPQSRPVRDRAELDERYRLEELRWADRPVERPPHWFGWRLVPDEIEFWQGRADRFHDRIRYRRGSDRDWTVERLAP